MAAIEPKSNSRWLRFSLRSLAVAVTVCAILFAIFGQRIVRWCQQQAAVSELSKFGSRFSYKDGWVTFGHMIGVRVEDRHIRDLRAMPTLRGLQLEMSKVTDAGMANLKPLKNLEHLDMTGVSIGDRGLENLETLTNLKHLDIIATRITDAGLIHLKPLTKLQVLRLNDTAVTDAGLENLAGMSNLQELSLQNAATTAEGVARLQERLPGCKILTEMPAQPASVDMSTPALSP
jgi:hypothetical protein